MKIRPFLAALLCAGACAGCRGTTEASARFAEGFSPANHKVSVFGVYKDGRMNSEAWGGLAPRITAALGGGRCEPAYGATVFAPTGDISAAIDDYANANGLSDDLLAQLAPAADGDLVLVLTVAGKLPVQKRVSVQDAPRPPPGSTGGGPYGARGGRSTASIDTNELELSAKFFSVSQARSVASIDIEYTGASIDEAMQKFGALIALSLPGSVCSSWNAEAKLDAARIRTLGEPQN